MISDGQRSPCVKTKAFKLLKRHINRCFFAQIMPSYESIILHPSGSQDWDTNYMRLVLKKDKFTLHGFEIMSNGEGQAYYRDYGTFVVKHDKLILTIEASYSLDEETGMILEKIEEVTHGEAWELCEQTAKNLRKLTRTCLEKDERRKSTVVMKLYKERYNKKSGKIGSMIKAPYRPFNPSSWSQYGKIVLHKV